MLINLAYARSVRCNNKFKVNNMSNKKDDFEFDDCPICQAMKEGKASTMEELKEAFKKAKEQGAVVGGTMLMKNKGGIFNPRIFIKDYSGLFKAKFSRLFNK